MQKSTRSTITIRVPLDLKTAVAAAAKKDDRSITGFVVRALRAAVGKPKLGTRK